MPWNIPSAQAFWFSVLLISLPGDERLESLELAVCLPGLCFLASFHPSPWTWLFGRKPSSSQIGLENTICHMRATVMVWYVVFGHFCSSVELIADLSVAVSCFSGLSPDLLHASC